MLIMSSRINGVRALFGLGKKRALTPFIRVFRAAVELVGPGRSQQAEKERVCVTGDGRAGFLSRSENRGSCHAFSKSGIMFRQDGPIVTIITSHAGSGCHHGALISGGERRFGLQ